MTRTTVAAKPWQIAVLLEWTVFECHDVNGTQEHHSCDDEGVNTVVGKGCADIDGC